MTITRADVQHVARLARLGPRRRRDGPPRVRARPHPGRDAGARQLDTSAIPPTAQVIPLHNVMREDVSRPSWPVEDILRQRARHARSAVPRPARPRLMARSTHAAPRRSDSRLPCATSCAAARSPRWRSPAPTWTASKPSTTHRAQPADRHPRARRSPGRAGRRAPRSRRDGPLLGVPMILKDVLITRGIRTTAGSKILENFVPIEDGTITRRLAEAGAVLLGKTNMDEFAMGSSTENSAYLPHPQPVGPRAGARRLERRLGGGGRRRVRAVRAGHRHRRLDPPARRAVRRRRPQADLRPRQPLRPDRVRVVARPDRPVHAHRRRRRAR